MAKLRSMFHRARLGLLIAVLACDLSAKTPDIAEDIRPAKEAVAIPQTFAETLREKKLTVTLALSIGGSVLLLGVGLLLWRKYYIKQRRNSSARIALLALRELEADQDKIGAEAFAYLASKVVRQYIAAHLGVAAPLRTTEEFLRDLAQDDKYGLSTESDHLRTFLKSCDLAKFAGTELNSAQRYELVVAARNFVNSTSKTATP